MTKKTKTHKLPKGWLWTTLGELGVVESGSTPSTKEPQFWGGDIAWITPADLSDYKGKYISKGKRNISKLGLEYSSAILLPKESLLFSSRAPIGYVVIAQNELATNQGFKNLIPVESIRIDYVYYYLQSAKQLAESMASGTTFPELSVTNFSKIPIPLPPLNEQYRIVEKIEELFSEIDNGISNLIVAQNQLTVYRKALLKHAFAGKLTKDWRIQNNPESAVKLLQRIKEDHLQQYEQQLSDWKIKINEWTKKGKRNSKPIKPLTPKKLSPLTKKELEALPELPEGWVWSKVDEMLEYGRNCAYGVVQPGPHINEGVTLIRVGDITN